jgi:SAM-dependent methyltransferase
MGRLHFLIYRIRTRIRCALTGRSHRDDFDWGAYTDHYKGELSEIAKEHTQILKSGDYEFSNGCLAKKGDIRPLHPNSRLVYETILQLAPQSAMEMGCGGGDHLANLALLAPGIRLRGVDLSERQIALLKERHPHLKCEIRPFDLTSDPEKNDLPQVDLAYTQAVLMHIRDREAYLRGLINVFRVGREYVVLMENWKRNDFVPDILALFEKKKLAWDTLFLYYRESPEFKKPHLLIASRRELTQYPVLHDYATLRDPVTG